MKSFRWLPPGNISRTVRPIPGTEPFRPGGTMRDRSRTSDWYRSRAAASASIALASALSWAAPARAAIIPQDCQTQLSLHPNATNCASNAWVTGICGQYWGGSDPDGVCRPFLDAKGATYQATHQAGPLTAKVYDQLEQNFKP